MLSASRSLKASRRVSAPNETPVQLQSPKANLSKRLSPKTTFPRKIRQSFPWSSWSAVSCRTVSRSCSTFRRSRATDGLSAALQEVKEAAIIYREKLLGLLFDCACIAVAALFTDFVVNATYLDTKQYLAILEGHILSNVFVRAREVVQAKGVYSARLKYKLTSKVHSAVAFCLCFALTANAAQYCSDPS